MQKAKIPYRVVTFSFTLVFKAEGLGARKKITERPYLKKGNQGRTCWLPPSGGSQTHRAVQNHYPAVDMESDVEHLEVGMLEDRARWRMG